MDDLTRRAVVAVVRPPLVAVRWLFGNAYRLLFSWWLDDRLVRRAREEFAGQVRENLTFLFTERNAQIVSNDTEPPPYFDFAKVTIAADDLLFIFTRDRGAVHVAVAPNHSPKDWQDLSTLLGALDGSEPSFSRLPTIARLISTRWDEMKDALSENQFQKTKQRLQGIHDAQYEQTRRVESALNRRLYGP